MLMKKIFTLIAAIMMAGAVSAQIQTIASYTVTENSVKAGDDNTADAGTACSVQLHGTTIEKKDAGVYGLKLDSDAKYVQIDLDEALQEGDAVKISYFAGSNSSEDDKNGVSLTNAKPSSEDYAVLATMYVQKADKKNVVTKAYTAVGGEKKFFVYKINGSSSVYFHKVEVTRGSEAPKPLTAATTWNFTVLSAADEAALNADATNWEAKTGDGEEGWANKTVLTARNVYVALTANGNELDLTKGLQFTRDNNSGLDAGKIFIKKNKAINISGSACLIKIADLAKNDKVKIQFYSNGDESRGFNVTNADKTEIMSSGKTDYQQVELVVAANGDLTLSSTKSVNVQAITINTDLPEITSGIATLKADAFQKGAIFNLAGQKVSENYKGVVIQNGRKMIQK